MPPLAVQFAQKAFIVNSSHLLLIQKSAKDPLNPLLWEVPGGRMEDGDDIDGQLTREVQEEVGLEIIPGHPFYLWSWIWSRELPDGTAAGTKCVCVARLAQPITLETSLAKQLPGENIAVAKWVPFNELKSYRYFPGLETAIEAFLATRKVDA